MLAQASTNEVKGEKVEKDGVMYEQIKTLHLDGPFIDSTFKGFFGRTDSETQDAGILRLGLIWGSTKQENAILPTKGAKTFDYEAPADENEMALTRMSLMQKEKELTALREAAAKDNEALRISKENLANQAARLKILQDRENEADGPKQFTIAQAGTIQPPNWQPSTAAVAKFGQVTFPTRYRDPPRLVTALSLFDQGNPREIGFAMQANNITNTGFTASFSGRDNTDMGAPRMSWLALPENDVQFETGIFDTAGYPKYRQENNVISFRTRGYFSRPFQNRPVFVPWICNMNLPNSWHSLTIDVHDCTTEYFDLSIQGWCYPERDVHGARIAWLACDPTGKKGKVQTGLASVMKDERWKTETVSLNAGFSKPPAVFVALRHLDVSNDHPARLAATVSDVTSSSFKLEYGTWDFNQDMYMTQWSWIAIE